MNVALAECEDVSVAFTVCEPVVDGGAVNVAVNEQANFYSLN